MLIYDKSLTLPVEKQLDNFNAISGLDVVLWTSCATVTTLETSDFART
jgi:hypothetical protein